MKPRIKALSPEIATWRRDIHQHPELGFEEVRTANLVAEKLESFGIDVHRGLAKTGVVGTLRSGNSSRVIGLRADMDALPMQEHNSFAHRSVYDHAMHACGHDGHTAMLLGAAQYLAQTRHFDGTVHFIFQPAEEGLGGADAMVKDGLFEQFPVDEIYGLHNWPGLPVGEFAVCAGAMEASSDYFDITIRGKGGHAAMPDQARDPIVIAGQLIGLLQTITSRHVRPVDAAVVSITQINAGSAYNVIPETVTLHGNVRTLNPHNQECVRAQIEKLLHGLCDTCDASGELVYRKCIPVLINTEAETAKAAAVARAVAGDDKVDSQCLPTMGAEDFAFMLQEKPGCYIFMGNGGDEQGASACVLHNPHYDFNDEAIEWGVQYWCQLVETLLKTART